MKGVVSACALVVVIFGLHRCVTAGKPRMTPSENFTIQAGDRLNIKCQGEGSKLQFSTQKLTAKVEQSEFNISVDGDSYTLIRPRAKKEDTGWYACAKEGIAIQNDEQTIDHPDTDISWIYVFVNSSYPFAVASTETAGIPVVAGRRVVIPCRPTSKKLPVTLKRVLPTPSESEREIPYDSKVGFTIEEATKSQTGYIYQCITDESDQRTNTRSIYQLNVSDPDPLKKPVIDQGSKFYVIKGRSLKLCCRITVPKGDKFRMEWQVPRGMGKEKILSKKPIAVGDATGTRIHWKIELTTNNVRRIDRGEYICVATGVVNNASSSIEVQVWEPGNITGGQVARAKLNESATLSCLVEGYSLSNFSWAKINDSESSEHSGIENTPYSINGTHVAMSLDLTNVTRKDHGTYECRATDYASIITGRTSLIVTEVPEVKINHTMSGTDTVYLGWMLYDGNDPVITYSIEHMKIGTDQWENSSEPISGKNFSCVVQGLARSTVYRFSVTATNSIGNSQPAYSDAITTQKKDPEFLSEVTVEKTSDTSMTIFWTPPEGKFRNSFQYYRLLERYGNYIRQTVELPINVTTYVFHDIQSGSQIEIKACNHYTLHCASNSSPKKKGILENIGIWSGFIAAVIILAIGATWIIIRRRREIAWRRNCRLASFDAARF